MRKIILFLSLFVFLYGNQPLGIDCKLGTTFRYSYHLGDQTVGIGDTAKICHDIPSDHWDVISTQAAYFYKITNGQCVARERDYHTFWTESVDVYACLSCSQNDIPYPSLSTNQRVTDKWSEPDDHSQQCSDANGSVQERTISCKKEYRCVQETDSCPTEDPQKVGSYVTPRDGVFHEDIQLTGAPFGLHYTSGNLEDTTIAHGWSIDSHARLVDDRVYYGSGAIYLVTDNYAEGNLTVIKSGTSELLFDSSGTLLSIRDLYTKETKTTFSYDLVGRLVTISDFYGQISAIERDSDGTVTAIVAPTGQRTLLSVDSSGDLSEVQYEDGSSYGFEYERHLMTKEIEPNGNEFEHFFDPDGKIIKVIDAEQGEWLFGTGNYSQMHISTSQVTRASGDVVLYKNHFLSNGILKSETRLPSGDLITYENAVDDTNSTVTSCGMRTTSLYRTNDDGTLYHDPYTGHRVLASQTITTPSGLTKTTDYTKTYTEDAGTLATIESTQTTNTKRFTQLRDIAHYLSTSATPEDRNSTVQYDTHHQNITQMQPYGLLPSSYTYDAQGRMLTSTTGTRTTSYSYDSRGNLASTTDPLGRVTTYAYDSRDRLTETTYADGTTLHYSYDSNGNMTMLTTPTPTEHTFGYNGVNKRTSYDSPLGKSTAYTYDKQRRITQITKPSGATIDTTYTNGRVTQVETPEGSTNYAYACQSLPSTITHGSESISYSYDGTLPTGMTYSGILNQAITTTYNSDFLPASMTYAGATTSYSYDRDGLLTSAGAFNITRTLDTTLHQSLTDGSYTQETHFNGYGEVAEQNDSLFGYQLERNANGQITRKVETLSGAPTTTTYTYDDRGRLTEVRSDRPATAGSNLLHNAGFESVIEETPQGWHPYGINTTQIADTQYSYTGDYSVKITNDSSGNSGWRADEISIDHQKTLTFGGWSRAEDVSAGALYALDFKVTFEDGSIQWYYADTKFATGTHEWQQISITTQFDKPVVSVRPYALLYRGTGTVWFDDISVQVGGVAHTGLYNGGFETLSGDTPTGWRSYNNTTPIADTEQAHSGDYAIKITNDTDANAGWYSRVFDMNHTHTITFAGWSRAEDVSEDALYALDFKVTFEDGSYLWYYADTKFSTGTHDWEQTTVTKTFDKAVVSIRAYALLYRGTGTVWFDDITVTDEEADPQPTLRTVETYTYDANGNRATATVEGTTTTASYTLDDQLIVYGDTTYRYDDDGYLEEKTTPDGTTTYSYGTLGELKAVTITTSTGSVTEVSYQHNALNQRVAKLINGEIVEKYLWADLTTLLAVYDGDDTLIQRFAYAGGRMPVAMTDTNGTTYYLHYDQVGSLRAISRVLSPDNTTQLVKEVTYDTYGKLLTDSNSSLRVPFGFAGGLYDPDTGLTRFGYRDYDAFTGKWTAKDPIGFDGGDSNLYGYVLLDPVNFIDPEGLATKDVPGWIDSFFGWIDILNTVIHEKDCVKKLEKMHSFCKDKASGWFGLSLYYCNNAASFIFADCEREHRSCVKTK